MNQVSRPHHLAPKKETARVILTVKNFAAIKGVCHIGLAITATNTMKVLRRDGYFAEVWRTQTSAEIHRQLLAAEKDTTKPPVTHVVISAPWIRGPRLHQFTVDFPHVEFVLLNHSGCAFLSMDGNGLCTNYDAIGLELASHNFRVACNNPRVNNWMRDGLGAKGLLLPNLYDAQSFIQPPPPHWSHGDVLRIGSFGATRPWKNQLVAMEAAIQLGRQLGVDVELYVNSGRLDGGSRMFNERKLLCDRIKGFRLVDVPWEIWPEFRRTIAKMHMLLQPSFDETFNVVTADGIAEGIPSVVTSSIEWAPREWMATAEDPATLVKVALYLLSDRRAVEYGRDALSTYAQNGLERWRDYLGR